MPQSITIYKRRSLPRRTKEFVWQMTFGRCWYCGHPTNPFHNFQIDHVVPLSRGGTDGIENLVPCCDLCNSSKGTMLLEEWRLTDACRANVLDSPDDGRFWFERHWDEDRWLGIWRKHDHEWWRDLEVHAFYCPMGDD